MRSINIHEAKTNLSRIAEEVAAGEEVIVVKAVKPKMKLVPIDNIKKKIKLGALKGKIQISKDFDAPLPPNIIDEFYGRNQWDYYWIRIFYYGVWKEAMIYRIKRDNWFYPLMKYMQVLLTFRKSLLIFCTLNMTMLLNL